MPPCNYLAQILTDAAQVLKRCCQDEVQDVGMLTRNSQVGSGAKTVVWFVC